MLWSRFGGSIQLGSAPPPRLYLIPLSASVEHEGPLAIFMGHQNRAERNLDGITRALDRAVSGEYDGVIFPSAILTLPFRHEVFSRCQSRGLRIVHQLTTEAISTEHYSKLKFSLGPKVENEVADPELSKPADSSGDPFTRIDELMRRLDAGDALNLVFGATSLPKESLIARLTRWPDQVYFTYSVRSKDPSIDLLHRLQPFIRERLFFHFPYHLEFDDGNLSCQQIFDLTERIHARVPGVRVRPMLGVENFDPRVDPELELEPIHKPVFETIASNSNSLEISVIIPSYNNRDYLLNTIKHLSRQNYPASRFEVIVVDDGSNDGSQTAVQSLAQSFDGKLNFKYIYSPRLKPRKMGDANYRAGISRNLGVKNSRGRILCFLDSDILTPPNYLAELVEKHNHFDVIQCKRLNLVRGKSDADVRFEEVNGEADTFTTEDGYWEKFYAIKDWGKEPFFWKYTCTYGLSVPAKLFKRVGWIRKGFVFYGFEDVELGYRLAQAGSRFHLNQTVTYHLFHKNERSEFHNSDYLRQALLAKTAQIFYLGRLEPEIFFHFRGLMKEQLPLASFVKFAARRLGLAELFENGRHGVQSNSQTGSDTATWLKIPFLAIWNWRWFLWRQAQRAKNNSSVKRAVTAINSGMSILKVAAKSIATTTTRPLQFEKLASKLKPAASFFPLWRLKRLFALGVSKLQLWRLKIAFQWLWGQRWRIAVPARRIADKLQIWRLQIVTSRFASQLWRLQVFSSRAYGILKFQISKVPFWKIRVLGEWVVSQAWRLRVPTQRAIGAAKFFFAQLELWRIKAIFMRLIADSWRLRVGLQRIAGSANAFLRSIPIWKVKTILWKVMYPIRKIYYIASFQWQKRFSKRLDSSEQERR